MKKIRGKAVGPVAKAENVASQDRSLDLATVASIGQAKQVSAAIQVSPAASSLTIDQVIAHLLSLNVGMTAVVGREMILDLIYPDGDRFKKDIGDEEDWWRWYPVAGKTHVLDYFEFVVDGTRIHHIRLSALDGKVETVVEFDDALVVGAYEVLDKRAAMKQHYVS